MSSHAPLPPSSLARRCTPAEVGIATTAEIPPADGGIGQGRALSVLDLAMHMPAQGHNVYVMGESGSGRHAAVQSLISAAAAARARPPDWCYVYRFSDPQRPRALQLPAGRAGELKTNMRQLVEELRSVLPAVFESEGYRNRRTEIDHEFDERNREALEALQTEAETKQLGLVQTPHGFAIAPMRNGEVLSPDDFGKLPEPEQQKARDEIDRLSEKLKQHVEKLPQWQREHRRRIRELDRDVTATAVGAIIAELREKYREFPAVITYLQEVEADLLEHAGDLRGGEKPPMPPGLEAPDSGAQLERYGVNVVVDGAAASGAPVIYEANPTHQNLIGRIENVATFGALVTNFTMIRPGALHRANGGFLVVDAERLLTQPFAWNALKRALLEKEIRIESLAQTLSLISTVSLEPEPIPLAVRVVLVGPRLYYYLLQEYDPDFAELFKLVADFDDHVDRTPAAVRLYAGAIASLVHREQLLPLDAAAVARLVDYGARLAGDADKLSTHIRSIEDAVREADYQARAESAAVTGEAHVQRALDEQRIRQSRVHREILDAIRRNTLLIDCTGEATGQVNGLSVMQLGHFAFGQPSRITATVRVGAGEVVDIEREVELGGAIHSKGVLILGAFIGARFGAAMPLSLRASLVFEQSYGGVEGDSASLAETCALLSALAEVPVDQSLAVTGSVNQHGVVQAVGGINEKIEGFYAVCKERGLTGEQGVLIPADNVQHLMLRDEVVAAAAAGRFHIHAVRTVDEAIGFLTGLSAGERDAHGAWSRGSINALAEGRLAAFARLHREHAHERDGRGWRRPLPRLPRE